MQGKLQRKYRVAQELGRNGFFSGHLKLSQMPRLGSLVIANDVQIRVTFEFLSSTIQPATIRGHIDAELSVVCQRCLEPMIHSVNQDFALLIDASEEDVESFQMDTVYTDEGYLDVYEVVEDELILTLPMIMMHEDKFCNEYWEPDVIEDEQAPADNNPFAALSALKGKG